MRFKPLFLENIRLGSITTICVPGVEALISVLDLELDAKLQEAGVDSVCKLAAAPDSRQQLVQQVTAALMLYWVIANIVCALKWHSIAYVYILLSIDFAGIHIQQL